MEQGLKERLTGAAILVILAVIFIPMLLDDTEDGDIVISETNIPSKPENMPGPPEAEVPVPDTDFTSRVTPLEEVTPEEIPEPEVISAPEPEPMPAPETADSAQIDEQPVTPVASPEEPQPAPTTGQQSAAAVMQNDEASNHVGLSAWVVQLGSFASEPNAETLNQKLRKAGFRSFVEPLQQGGQVAYRVRVGPELKRSDAQAINEKLKKTLQLQGIVVQYP